MLIEIKSVPSPVRQPSLGQPSQRVRGTLTARNRRTPGERLLEALSALAQGKATVVTHAESTWASITFAGTRHRLVLEFAGEERWRRARASSPSCPSTSSPFPANWWPMRQWWRSTTWPSRHCYG